MAEKLNLSRQQLATFCKDFEQIKQFEKLFGRSNLAASDLEDLLAQAGAAFAASNEALAQLTRIADALEFLAQAPRVEPALPECPPYIVQHLSLPEPDVQAIPFGAQQMNDLADVRLSPPLSGGSVLVYDTSKWRNKAMLEVGSGGTGKNSFTANYLIKGDGANPLKSSTVYDDGAGHVGIGTNSPTEPLEVAGSIYAQGVGSSLFATDKNFAIYVTGVDATIEVGSADYFVFNRTSNAFKFIVAGNTIAEFTASAMVGAIGGGVHTLTAGAADSGGVGYRLVRIPN